MSRLIEIIEEDIESIGESLKGGATSTGDAAIGIVKGSLKGFIHGLYTPFNIRAGIIHQINNQKETNRLLELMSDTYFQAGTVIGHLYLANYLFSNGYKKEYIGTLVASNVITYLADAYKRSRLDRN